MCTCRGASGGNIGKEGRQNSSEEHDDNDEVADDNLTTGMMITATMVMVMTTMMVMTKTTMMVMVMADLMRPLLRLRLGRCTLRPRRP